MTNVKFSIDLDFDSDTKRGKEIFKSIALMLVACLGKRSAKSFMHEAQQKLKAGEPIKITRKTVKRAA